MDVLTLAMWIGTAIFLIFSFAKNKGKTKQALKMAFGMGKGMLGSILSIIFLIGLILTILPPESIAEFVGKQSLLLATVISSAFGTITLIPAFIAFPLVGTLGSRWRGCRSGCRIFNNAYDGWYRHISA